jgi:outer membrane protein OmpA-like peptidoglycan-associated protein
MRRSGQGTAMPTTIDADAVLTLGIGTTQPDPSRDLDGPSFSMARQGERPDRDRVLGAHPCSEPPRHILRWRTERTEGDDAMMRSNAIGPVVTAVLLTACAGSQKQLTEPQRAALQAEDRAQQAQNEAQKAREESQKAHKDLVGAQRDNNEARQAELTSNQQAQQASEAAARAEQRAGMAVRPPATMGPPRGVTERQGMNAPPPPAKVVVISTALLFPTGKAALSDDAKPKLDELAAALRSQPQQSTLLIEGHTDDVGTREKNLALSNQRAQAVGNYLESQGIAQDRVTIQGVADERPIGNQKTSDDRALNRRVDIVVQQPAELKPAKSQ